MQPNDLQVVMFSLKVEVRQLDQNQSHDSPNSTPSNSQDENVNILFRST